MAMAVASLARLAILRRTSDAVPCSLYSHSLRSCRPQPRGSDGDVTPRQDTRQDRRLSFLLPFTTYCCIVALRSLSVGELTGCRASGIGVNAGARVDVPATLGECWGQGFRWTYWRHCGNVGPRYR